MSALRHAATRYWAHGVIVACALAATWTLFATPGMPYNVDISGFFPLTPGAYEDRFWPLWNEHGGMSTAQFLPALLLELPLLLVGRIAGLDMAAHIKLRMLGGLIIAGLGMLSLVRYYLRRERPDAAAWLVSAAALAPALFFMLNPWSIHRIFHYFLWTGYVLAPWVVLAFERLAESPRWPRALVLAALAALATTDPHNPPYLAILLAPLALLRVAQATRVSWRDAARLLRAAGLAAGAYVALCAFWILPYAYSARNDPGFGPTYVMSGEMIGVLSRNADILSVLRLMHNYLPRAAIGAAEPWTATWGIVSFALPLLAVHALILRPRSSLAWTYGGLAAACVALGMGTRAPFGGAYEWLVFRAPWGEGLSWLFRDPYRWGGAQAFAYSILLGIAIMELSARAGSLRVRALARTLRPAAPVIAIACVALFIAPAATGYMTAVYAPVVIPAEYGEANAHLATMEADAQVVWMPRMLGATTWAGNRTLEYFDATSSARAALGPFRPHTSAYFDLVTHSATTSADETAELLTRAGVGTVVYHNDRDPARGAWTMRRLQQDGFAPVASFGDSPVQRVDGSGAHPAGTPASVYAIHGTRTLAQSIIIGNETPTAISLAVKRVGNVGPIELRLVDAEARTLASRNVTLGPDDREATLDLTGVPLAQGATYEVRAQVAQNGASGPDDRSDASYYTLDAYDGGAMGVSTDGVTWKRLAGDARFTLAAPGTGFITILASPTGGPARVRVDAQPIASPEGLDLLPLLATLPQDAPLRDASVIFTHASEAARGAATRNDLQARWVASFAATPLDAVAAFLPAEAFVAPFGATTSADAATGWARGSPGFAYYEWGWPRALAEAKLDDRGFDLGEGLVYTSARATLAVDVAPADSPRALLARVFHSPRGGPLAFAGGDDGSIATIDTNASTTGFRWVEVGELAAGASRVKLTSHDGLQAVNVLAILHADGLAAAEHRAGERLATMPIALVQDASAVANATRVSIPHVGAFAKLTKPSETTFRAPRSGDHELWVRTSRAGGAPNATYDGEPIELSCAAACDGAAPWLRAPLGDVAAGTHTLGLEPVKGAAPLVGTLVVATRDAGIAPATQEQPRVTYERVDATRWRARVDDATGPILLVLAQPYDAGWVAEADGATARAVLIDGLTSGFIIDGRSGSYDVDITYAPHGWAQAGALVTAATVLVMLAATGWRLISPRLRRDPLEVTP